jgi:predicted nucleotide-binding protein (sugar kinase/HSP70/actin superfamily)
MFDVLATRLTNTRANNGCPTASITPETVEAAFTKETDLFRERGIRYIHPLVNLSNRRLLARQLHEALEPVLGLSEDENARAVEVGFRELERFEAELRRRGREVLDQVEQEGRLAIVLLGRPYHHDPGINHGILEEIQKLGYPILSQSTLPMDGDLLERLFGEEIRAGTIPSALSISDVWKTAFSANSNQKLWAAKFVARHPNLVAVEFSSFKCGHDAPIYSVVEQIMQCSGTPYFGFKDMDENRSASSIKLRIETMDYFLKRYRQERFGAGAMATEEIDSAVC